MQKKKIKGIVGILGKGEIGGAVAKICAESGYKILTKEINYDEIKDNHIDYLHVSIPEKNVKRFIEVVSKTMLGTTPKLTIINSSVTPGVTRKIYNLTKLEIIHSPVIGLHPDLYLSIKKYFPKIIGPVSKKAGKLAQEHFEKLGMKIEMFDGPEESESSKILDLVYYAWNIVFCKWMKEVCDDMKINFNQVYSTHNRIYNDGYRKLRPNVIRPILIPFKGPISGHCTIPDTVIFHKLHPTKLTKYILEENRRYEGEVENIDKERIKFLKLTNRLKK